MMKKFAIVLEWVGVAVLVGGAAFFAFLFFRREGLSVLNRAILLWVIGTGTLCYTPMGYIRFSDARAKADETGDAADRKAANARKRSLALRIICGVVLVVNGFLVLWRAVPGAE